MNLQQLLFLVKVNHSLSSPFTDQQITTLNTQILWVLPINNLYIKYKGHIIWIGLGGDANLPDIEWKTDTIKRHSNISTIYKAYIELVNDIGCQQIVDFPTRINNILKIFITN